MGVHERGPVRVTRVAHRVDSVVGVGVRRGPESIQECQHSHGRTKTAQHDGSIVTGAYSPCQARTAGADIMAP